MKIKFSHKELEIALYCYLRDDPEFAREIIKLRPNWFRDYKIKMIKDELLELAKFSLQCNRHYTKTSIFQEFIFRRKLPQIIYED